MGVLDRFNELPQFKETLKILSELDSDEIQILAQALVEEPREAPEGFELPSGVSWRRILSAYKILSAAVIEEGLDEAADDLSEFAREYSEEARARLLANIRTDSSFKEHLIGIQQRDSFLPIFQGLNMALDLRVIDSPSGTSLTPVVTARMQFDETIGGGESAVFQVPIEDLQDIIDTLSKLKEQVADIRNVAMNSPLTLWGDHFTPGPDGVK